MRPFGARARNQADASVGADCDDDWFSARVLVGEQPSYKGRHSAFPPGVSYVGARVGDLQF